MVQIGDILADKKGNIGWIVDFKNDRQTHMKYGAGVYIVEWSTGETSWQYASDVVDMKWALKQIAKIV